MRAMEEIMTNSPHSTKFDVNKLREDFPILKREIFGKKLVYLDNAATTQKPQQVIDSIVEFYSGYNSNIHRGVHKLSQESTLAYEEARRKVARFINAAEVEEVIFTKGTTESINLVANSFGKLYIHEGDEIIVSQIEHHANIVPWQMLAKERKAKLRVIPVDDTGTLDMDAYLSMLNEKTKIVAIGHISNVLGTVNPVKFIIDKAHELKIPVLLDGAQSVHHTKVDVQALGCDFFCFSGHKVYGPTGIGVLYGKRGRLQEMPPYQGGGDMIKSVKFSGTTFNEIPFVFEAGTTNIAGAIGLGTALDYISEIGIDNIATHEQELLHYATQRMNEIEGLTIIGTAKDKASIISFVFDGIHHYDIGTLIDKMGVAIRTGQHCCEPTMDRYCISGTARASFAMYNTKEEIDTFIKALSRALQILR